MMSGDLVRSTVLKSDANKQAWKGVLMLQGFRQMVF